MHILVVEDEAIIAMHIESTLRHLGYDVSLAASADEAIQVAASKQPDLALLDIVLAGSKDGIETATELSQRFGLPFVYLTGHSDDKTLERAKATEPLGYVLKPFHEKQLGTTIEIALQRHAKEKSLRSGLDWSAALLELVQDAVIMTDAQAKVSFMNGAGERLTGTMREAASHRDVGELFQSMVQPQREALLGALSRALRDREVVELPVSEGVLTGVDGASYRADRIVPLNKADGSLAGATLVFRWVAGGGRPASASAHPEPSEGRRSHSLIPFAVDKRETSLNGPAEPATALEDPRTGSPSRAQAENALAAARERGRHVFVALFVIERVPWLVQRFGPGLAEEVLEVYGVFLAHNLPPGAELYRWTGPSFLVLLEREGSEMHIRKEVARLGSLRMERVFEMKARSALLFISAGWTTFSVLAEPTLDAVVHRIEDFVAASQRLSA